MRLPFFSRLPARFVPRSLWIGVLFVLMGFISLISPRLFRAAVATMPKEATPPIPPVNEQATQRLQRSTLGHMLGAPTIPDLPLPEADDMLIFSFGIPVVPWLKRVGIRQWQFWLDHLGETLRARYPDRPDVAAGLPWEQWIAEHVRYVEVHFAHEAAQRLAKIAASLPAGPGGIYLFGHSTGGATVLNYLVELREGHVPSPARPIRVALAMNSAVVGMPRAWTGWPAAPEHPNLTDHLIPRWRRFIRLDGAKPRWDRRLTWSRDYLQSPFHGLGAWTKTHGIVLLTVSNVVDLFTHPALDDVPFLKMHIGRRLDLKGTITGRTHLHVQRDPRVAHFLWWHDDVPLNRIHW